MLALSIAPMFAAIGFSIIYLLLGGGLRGRLLSASSQKCSANEFIIR